MNVPSALRFLLCFAALISIISVASAGGWDLVTVKDFPAFAEVGRPVDLTFKVWVPSLEPLAGLHPLVRATDARGHAVRSEAKASAATGEFTTTLTLTEPGDWTIVFDTEYENAATLPPLKVLAPGASAPNPVSPAARGLRLFTVKGCNGCHLHSEVKNGRLYGPDLTGKRFAAGYLTRFLAEPSITPAPSEVCSNEQSYCGSPYAMPKLNLTDGEIEALVAFITKK